MFIYIEQAGVMKFIFNNRWSFIRQVISGTLIRDTWQTLPPCDILLIRHDNDCGYTFKGKAYAHLIDSLSELFTKKGLTVVAIATPFSVLSGDLAYHSPVTYNQKKIEIECIKLAKKIFVGKEKAFSWAKTSEIQFWCNIFRKTMPRIIIGIQPDQYICQAGKRMKIPVYDLQHGTISENHYWYGAQYRIATPSDELPDGFLCWDEPSAATISKWATDKKIHILIIGNPWFERFCQKKTDDILVCDALAKGNIVNDTRPALLVSLQWGMKYYYPDEGFNGFLSHALEEVILDTKDIYNWILRLHPVQIRGEERESCWEYLARTYGESEAQRWLILSEIPLPVILRQTDLHITDMSTVVTEAAWMGVKSAILNQKIGEGREFNHFFHHERTTGMAEIIPQDPGRIKQWIVQSLAEGHIEPLLKDHSKQLDDFVHDIVSSRQS